MRALCSSFGPERLRRDSIARRKNCAVPARNCGPGSDRAGLDFDLQLIGSGWLSEFGRDRDASLRGGGRDTRDCKKCRSGGSGAREWKLVYLGLLDLIISESTAVMV